MAERDFAVVDSNNLVTRVIKCDVNTEQEAIDLCRQIVGNENATVVETFVNADKTSSTRYHFASVGYTWDSANNAFIAPKPYSSWVLNNSYEWESPVGTPNPPVVEDTYIVSYWNKDQNRWEAWDAQNQVVSHYYDGTNWISL